MINSARHGALKAMSDRDYHDFLWQQIGGKEHPYIAEKTKIILDIIPKECSTIIDVGCGDGAITNVLAEGYPVTGCDISLEALKYLSTKVSRVRGSADYLPFKDKCADLVLSSELLEHLPEGVFVKAISEIKRISRKYILITVPNDESLRKRYTKCNACGFEFHIYGHLRSFNLKRLARLFKEYNVRYSTLCGAPDERYPHLILYLENKLANTYFSVDNVSIICRNCGHILDFSFEYNFVQRVIGFSLGKFKSIQDFFLNRKPEPDWLVVLFEKTDRTRGKG
jgi:SAM-dependent methyltransferase